MKKATIFLFGILALASCTPSSATRPENTTSSLDSLVEDTYESSDTTESSEESVFDPYLYAEMDSVFSIKGKAFRVNVKQFNLTEIAVSKGDTILSRPTYSCAVRIMDENKKTVFSDSLLRDSWAYPGKSVSIDSYQIALPQLSNEGNEIIMGFNIYEDFVGDIIIGFIAFDINKLTSRYYWEESAFED